MVVLGSAHEENLYFYILKKLSNYYQYYYYYEYFNCFYKPGKTNVKIPLLLLLLEVLIIESCTRLPVLVEDMKVSSNEIVLFIN